MALIDCRECGKQISDQALSCPNCGAPVAREIQGAYAVRPQAATVPVRNVGFLLGLGIFLVPLVFVWFLLRQGHSTTSRVVGFAWFVFCLFAVFTQDEGGGSLSTASNSKSAASMVVNQPEEPLREYTARQIATEYDRNTVAADQIFKGKRFKVTGVVDSINTDIFGNPYVTLRGGVNQFMEPHFDLDKAHSNYAARLSQGMRISLICKGLGDVAKTPMLGECVPAD